MRDVAFGDLRVARVYRLALLAIRGNSPEESNYVRTNGLFLGTIGNDDPTAVFLQASGYAGNEELFDLPAGAEKDRVLRGIPKSELESGQWRINAWPWEWRITGNAIFHYER